MLYLFIYYKKIITAVHVQLILYLTKVRNSFIENKEKIY